MTMQTWKWVLVGMAAMVLVSAQALADDDAQARFSKANDLVMKDKAAEAVTVYQSLLDEGYGGAALHYNAGTAYLQAGKLGEAAWNFERALMLDPDCSDCKANYDKLKEMQKDKVVLSANEAKATSEDGFLASVPLASLTAFFTVFWVLFVVSVLAVRFVKGERPRVALILLATTALLASVGLGALREIKLDEYENVTRAVVMKDEVSVRKGPNANFDEAFTVHEGLVVKLGETMEDWRQVFLENGLHGFVPQQSLKPL